jgi:hypothetical protein
MILASVILKIGAIKERHNTTYTQRGRTKDTHTKGGQTQHTQKGVHTRHRGGRIQIYTHKRGQKNGIGTNNRGHTQRGTGRVTEQEGHTQRGHTH